MKLRGQRVRRRGGFGESLFIRLLVLRRRYKEIEPMDTWDMDEYLSLRDRWYLLKPSRRERILSNLKTGREVLWRTFHREILDLGEKSDEA